MNNYLLVTSLKLIVLNPYNYALNGNQCKNTKSFQTQVRKLYKNMLFPHLSSFTFHDVHKTRVRKPIKKQCFRT